MLSNVKDNWFFSLKTLRFARETGVKEFSIVEEQPGLEDADPMQVQWLECIFPSGGIHRIKDCIDNIKHRWKKDTIKKADNPFSEVNDALA